MDITTEQIVIFPNAVTFMSQLNLIELQFFDGEAIRRGEEGKRGKTSPFIPLLSFLPPFISSRERGRKERREMKGEGAGEVGERCSQGVQGKGDRKKERWERGRRIK